PHPQELVPESSPLQGSSRAVGRGRHKPSFEPRPESASSWDTRAGSCTAELRAPRPLSLRRAVGFAVAWPFQCAFGGAACNPALSSDLLRLVAREDRDSPWA